MVTYFYTGVMRQKHRIQNIKKGETNYGQQHRTYGQDEEKRHQRRNACRACRRFLFNYVCDIIPNDVVARGAAIVIMGILIGVGVGLLEQFAKAAWLKVIRGEFEGKEYLVFAGTTSIGNNGKNTIVLFKDKLVGSHHCDIKLEGSKYVLTDCGTPMGTIVNGQKTVRHVLRQGDAIAIGNSVLVFNTK